ncbi:MAG: DUF1003 domain-containing protein [Candidatus Altiarchaeota archaeon]|nr:DUF1003 domain-containing protein [Candidatus Altiarchaeota archaeon]
MEECDICHRRLSSRNLTVGELIQPSLFELIKRKHPYFSAVSRICSSCRNLMRSEYFIELVREGQEKITELENEVAESLKKQEILSEDIYKEYESELTFGERIADKVAGFGGSWTFISLFFLFVIAWMAINTYFIVQKPLDPFPYILLNLVLSCIAAIQAPVIMMSQNRVEGRDRMRSQYDYQINLKAELEIRQLHEKLDLLIKNQWSRLMEVQKMQIDILEEMRK